MVIVYIIIAVVFAIVGGIIGVLISGNALWSELKKQKQISAKHLAFITLYDKWLELNQKQMGIKDYLEKNEIHSVAIYGMGRLGYRLYQELKKGEVSIDYVIDRNEKLSDFEVRCIRPEDEMPSTDLIIVTAVYDYEEIKDILGPKVLSQVISLEKIIVELLEM